VPTRAVEAPVLRQVDARPRVTVVVEVDEPPGGHRLELPRRAVQAAGGVAAAHQDTLNVLAGGVAQAPPLVGTSVVVSHSWSVIAVAEPVIIPASACEATLTVMEPDCAKKKRPVQAAFAEQPSWYVTHPRHVWYFDAVEKFSVCGSVGTVGTHHSS